MTHFEYAKHYLSIGWSIIPAGLDKKPLLKWEKYQHQRPTEIELAEWFSKPRTNMALVCGAISGIDVTDVDSYKKPNSLDFNSILQAKTPRGGIHHFFSHIDELRPKVNGDLAIDVRSDGSYVLVEPSVGPNGNKYSWNQFPTAEILKRLSPIPKEILVSLNPTSSVDFSLASTIGVSEGSRNDSLYKALCSMLSRLGLYDRETVGLKAAEGINNTFVPPLSGQEVLSVFRSALNFVNSHPPTALSTQSTAQPRLNWKPTTLEEDIDRVISDYKNGLPVGIPSGFPSLDKITGGLIPGQTYLIFADTNTGKSVFVLNILTRLAKSGIKCVCFDLENQYLLTAERQVLISEDNLTKKVWDLTVKEKRVDEFLNRLKLLPLRIWDIKKMQDRFGEITPEAVEKCIAEGVNDGATVFAVDHLHYFEPNTTDYSKLQEVARRLNDLASVHNIVILVVAHTKKGLTYEKDGKIEIKRPVIDDINGSSLIAKHTKNTIALMRNVASNDPNEQNRTICFVDKTKNGPSGKFELQFNPENLHFTDIAFPELDKAFSTGVRGIQQVTFSLDINSKNCEHEHRFLRAMGNDVECSRCGTQWPGLKKHFHLDKT